MRKYFESSMEQILKKGKLIDINEDNINILHSRRIPCGIGTHNLNCNIIGDFG